MVDASAVVALLMGNLDPERLGTEETAAPHLIDSEVTNALRRLVQHGELTPTEGDAAMDGFLALSLTRFSAAELRPRMWELRHNLSAYDATYVALAEAVAATELLTTDHRLSAAPGIRCVISIV